MHCGVCLRSEGGRRRTLQGWARPGCQPARGLAREVGDSTDLLASARRKADCSAPLIPLLAGLAAPAGAGGTGPWPPAPEQPDREPGAGSPGLCTFLGFGLPLLVPRLPLLSPTPAQPSGAGEYLTLLQLISNPLTFSLAPWAPLGVGAGGMSQSCSYSGQPLAAPSIPSGPPAFPGPHWGKAGPGCRPPALTRRLPPPQPGPPLQGLVPSLLPRILHVAMQTRGCQALRRQGLPCARPGRGPLVWPTAPVAGAVPHAGQTLGPLCAGKARATWIHGHTDLLPGTARGSPSSKGA